MSLTISGPSGGVFYQGNDYTWQFTVTDSDDAVVNISGMTPRFVMTRRPGETVALSSETSPQTVTIALSDPTNGIFTVAVDAADIASLLGTYEYQAQIEDGAGDLSNLLRGWFSFMRNIV